MIKKMYKPLAALLLLIAAFPAVAGFAQTLLPPGSLDPTFSENGKLISSFATAAADLQVQPDGKIVVVGTVQNTTQDLLVLRFNPDGSLDNSFSNDGRINSDILGGDNQAVNVFVLPDGNILVVSHTLVGDAAGIGLVRYYGTNGNLDLTFTGGGKTFEPFTEEPFELLQVSAAALLPDGKLLVAGVIRRPEMAGPNNHGRFLARFNSNGSLDFSFGGNGWAVDWTIASDEFDQYVNDIAVEPGGSVILVGQSVNPDHGYWMIARYNADGSFNAYLDEPYHGGPPCTNIQCDEFASGVVIQPDGKIVVAGTFTALYGPFGDDWHNTFYTVRLTPDGAYDPTFGGTGAVETTITSSPGQTGVQDRAFDLALQPDGKIVVVGGSENDFALVRYNPDGSPDTGFGENGLVTTAFGSTEAATVVAMAPDGKIVAAGHKDNGIPIARYIGGDAPQATVTEIWLPLILP